MDRPGCLGSRDWSGGGGGDTDSGSWKGEGRESHWCAGKLSMAAMPPLSGHPALKTIAPGVPEDHVWG